MRRQVWQQGTASQKQMVFDYDLLGRVTQRVDTLANGTNTTNNWVWDTRQTGQLTSRSTNGYLDNFYYDGKSRVSRRVTDITGLSNQTFIYTYDAFSRLKTETFPNGFVAEHSYHALGFQSQIKDISNNETHKTLWTLGNVLDERGNLTHSLYGNGVMTKLTFSSANGRVEKIQSGKLGSSNTYNNFYNNVQDLTYGFDSLGNLLQRRSERAVVNGNPVESLKEDFTYDSLNRLKTTVTRYGGWLDFSGQETSEAFYDNLGNITRKTRYATGSSTNADLGDFAYAQTGNAGPHAVTSAGGKNYVYDAYGNMVQRGSETLEYSVFNKPTRISGSSTTYLTYGPDHELYKEVNGSKTTYKLGNYEVEVVGTQSVQKSYVGDNIINSRTLNANILTDNTYFYMHMDYLGSLESTTDASGNLVNRASFDAWGNRRQSNWSSGTPSDNFVTQTGFTGHHQMDAHNLIHMGGRVYDPSLGRFLSADIFVQSPFNTQSFNRYSYVFNNPLSLNDPSGYCSGGPDWFSNYMMNKMVEMVESNHVSFVMLTFTPGRHISRSEIKAREAATKEFNEEVQKELEGSGLSLAKNGSSIVDSSGKTVGSVKLDLASGSVSLTSKIALNDSELKLMPSQTGDIEKTGLSWGGGEDGCMRAAWTCSRESRTGTREAPGGESILTIRPSSLGNMLNAIDLLSSINPFKLGTKGLIKQFRKPFIDCLRCFAAGTEILTENGFKPIETLKVGDLVWAHDPETGKTALKPIVKTFINTKDTVWELVLEKEGETYLHEVTASHPYYVIDTGWVEVGDLQRGQVVKTKDGKPATIKSLKDTGVIAATYNFEVKDINSYYVSAAMVLVHNHGPCGKGWIRITKNWKARDIKDPSCRNGCENVAEQIQKLIGGKTHTIKPLDPNPRVSLGAHRGHDNGWYHHAVVVKDGRVYDAFTGSKGASIAEYKSLWKYADGINFGF